MEKRIYVDMDDTLCHFERAFAKARQENPAQPFPQSQWGFFIGLEPYEGAVEAFAELSARHDVWILTKPSVRNLNCYTEKAKWVFDRLGQAAVGRLILCPDKSLLKGDYLVDDRLWPGFEGEQIHFGSDRFPDWASVLDYLL